MSEITNTTRDEPLPHAIMGGDPGAIEDQEARGQAELVASTLLPTDMGDRDAYEALGFRFGEPGDDSLFLPAELPEGWTKRATGHNMWSEIVDSDGKHRVGVFYKAAFYDRSAHMRIEG